MSDFDNTPYRTNEGTNKHGKNRVRELTLKEKDFIREEFVKANGQLKDGFCSQLSEKFGPDISVFQIVGYVTHKLHFQAKNGDINLKDLDSYKKVLKKHRDKWATYNSPKYQPHIKYRKFFELYMDYQEQFDKFIWKIARRHQVDFDPCEMYSQIMFKLLKSNVINDYKKEMNCKFKSYIVLRILGYATHILKPLYRERKIRVYAENIQEADFRPYNPTLKNVDEVHLLKERHIYAKNNLSKRDYRVYVLTLKGYSHEEIARKIKRSLQGLNNAYHRIGKALKTFKEI